MVEVYGGPDRRVKETKPWTVVWVHTMLQSEITPESKFKAGDVIFGATKYFPGKGDAEYVELNQFGYKVGDKIISPAYDAWAEDEGNRAPG